MSTTTSTPRPHLHPHLRLFVHMYMCVDKGAQVFADVSRGMMYMHVGMYCAHVSMYVYICIYKPLYTTHTCIYVCKFTNTYIYTHTHICE